MAEQIEAKLYTYDSLSMKNKRFTHDIVGHMVGQPYWTYPKTYKNTPLKRSPGDALQSLLFLVFITLGAIAAAVCGLHTAKIKGMNNLNKSKFLYLISVVA